MNTSTFDYDMFLTLTDSALVAYMEPLLVAQQVRVPQEVLHRMLEGLCSFDEYHLVYALQLGCDKSPEMYAPQVPKYLVHDKISVCCAAANILKKLPAAYLTRELVDAIRGVLSTASVRQLIAESLEPILK